MGEEESAKMMARMALCAALVSAAIAMPMLTPDPPGVFCRYKNSSMVDSCNDGGVCAVKNVTSALDFCEDMYLHDFAVELPYMGSNFTTPYLDGFPAVPPMALTRPTFPCSPSVLAAGTGAQCALCRAE